MNGQPHQWKEYRQRRRVKLRLNLAIIEGQVVDDKGLLLGTINV